MDGRFYVKDAGGNTSLLVGAAVGDLLNTGHVYEIRDLGGIIQLVDLGTSDILGDDADIGSVDKLLALSGGRHCITQVEQSRIEDAKARQSQPRNKRYD